MNCFSHLSYRFPGGKKTFLNRENVLKEQFQPFPWRVQLRLCLTLCSKLCGSSSRAVTQWVWGPPASDVGVAPWPRGRSPFPAPRLADETQTSNPSRHIRSLVLEPGN